MKRFLLLIAFFGTIFVNAQHFEGTITYQISYPTIQDKAALADKPTEMTLYIKGNKVRSDIKYQMYSTDPKIPPTPVSQSKIVDLSAKSYFQLLSVGKDYNFLIETSTKQIEDKILKKQTPNISFQDSTRMVSGYLCKIGILTVNALNVMTGNYDLVFPLVFYYTEALGNKNFYIDEDFNNIKGLMLEYTIFANQIPIKFTTIKIKKKKLKDSQFERPLEGYRKNVDSEQYIIEGLLNGKIQ